MFRGVQFSRATALKGSSIAAILSLVFGGIAVSLLYLADAQILNGADVDDWRPPVLAWSGLCLISAVALACHAAKISLPASATPKKGAGISNLHKSLLCAAALAWAGAVAFPKLSARVAKALERQWPATLSSNAVNVTLRMPIDCAACARGIEDTLRKETGVEKARASFENGELLVWFNPEQTSKFAVVESLKSHGYPPAKPSSSR